MQPSINFFNDPSFYNNNDDLQFDSAKIHIDSLVMPKNSIILDIGCGNGRLTKYLSTKVPDGKVLGIDKSQEMIEFANSHYSNNNLCFKQCLAGEIEFECEFDYIVSFYCFHWLQNQKSIFSKLCNSLTVNGKIYLYFPKKTKSFYDIVDFLSQSDKWCSFFKNFTNPKNFISEDDYRSIIGESGFSEISVESEVLHKKFISEEKVVECIRGWLPHVKYLNRPQATEFIKEIIEKNFIINKVERDSLVIETYVIKAEKYLSPVLGRLECK